MPNGSYNLMLDPSLLLDARTSTRVFAQVADLNRDGATVFVPEALRRFLNHFDAGSVGPQSVQQFLDFYSEEPQHRVPLRVVVDSLREREQSGTINVFEPDELEEPPHFGFRHYLDSDLKQDGLENIYLVDTIFQEWVFLQERSWITSRTRRTFDWMIRAGGTCVEYGKRSFDRVVRKVRGKEAQEEIKRVDRLKTVGKFIALGGILGGAATLLGLIAPPAPIAVAFALSEVFALIDP